MRIVAFFVRHGETDLNKKHEFNGPNDTDLNAEGNHQAHEIANFFQGRSFSGAFSSTKKRTRQTIEPLLEQRGMKAKVLRSLDSLDTGDYAGTPKTKSSLKDLKWFREHPDVTIPGGEKVRDFRKRADTAIMSIIHCGESGDVPAIAAVHGSIIRELSRLLHDDYNKARVDPGGVIAIFKSPYGYSAMPIMKEDKKEAEEVKPGS